MSGKVWKGKVLPIHGYQIVDEDNAEIVRGVYRRDHAEQIVNEHNAVLLAIESGKNWTLEDWCNWLRYHAQRPPAPEAQKGE